MTKTEKIKTTAFDVAEYLDSPEMIAAYLNEAFDSGDMKFIAAAIGDVARAKGMTEISEATGIARTSLYQSFDGKTKPEFDTVRKVLDSLGVKISVKPKQEKKKKLNDQHILQVRPKKNNPQ